MYSFSSLKVCFVGVGSIASKHILNLSDICRKDNIELHIDAVRRNSGANSSDAVMNAMQYVENVYSDITEAGIIYDIVFITNPTDMHISMLRSVEEYGRHFFIEKPVVSVARIEEADTYKKDTNKVYYVACPMRYTPVLQYIKNNVNAEDVISVRSISSSYLPQWRPGTDYRKCYSAIKALGGGVAIDLIHEWDYLAWLFGYPKDVHSFLSRKSNLEIDTEDAAVYIADYEDKLVELHLDYFGRKTMREIMIFTNDDTIVGDFVDNSVRFLKEGRIVNFDTDSRGVGQLEMRHFLDIIDGACANDNDIDTAVKTLKLTQGILE